MPRVFIAIPVPAMVRAALASLPRADERAWRWVREEQFHITLKFLGEIAESDVPSVGAAVADALSSRRGDRSWWPHRAGTPSGAEPSLASEAEPSLAPEAEPSLAPEAEPSSTLPNAAPSLSPVGTDGIRLSARGIGAFPHARRARVLWAGVTGDIDRLGETRAAIEDRLARGGYPRDNRTFKPHITLARSRGAGLPLPPALREYERHDFGSWVGQRIQVVESRLHPSGPLYIVRHEIPIGSGP